MLHFLHRFLGYDGGSLTHERVIGSLGYTDRGSVHGLDLGLHCSTQTFKRVVVHATALMAKGLAGRFSTDVSRLHAGFHHALFELLVAFSNFPAPLIGVALLSLLSQELLCTNFVHERHVVLATSHAIAFKHTVELFRVLFHHCDVVCFYACRASNRVQRAGVTFSFIDSSLNGIELALYILAEFS